jgi:hypothetical protein
MKEATVSPTGISQPDFIGRWVCVSEWYSEISLEIAKSTTIYSVRATDQSDGEEAEVYDVVHSVVGNMGTLAFGAYWSSGQFTKYKLRIIDSEMEVTYTHTDIAYYKRDDK